MSQSRRWCGCAVAAVSPLFPGLPGLGQFVQGRLRSGAAFALGLLALNIAVLDTGLLTTLAGGRIWMAVLALAWIISTGDAALDRTGHARAGWEMSTLAGAGLIALTIAMSSSWGLVRLTPVTQVFAMSQPFLAPVLEAGDHVVVSGNAYRNHPPLRGDVVVVRENGQVSPRFVLAVPGDQLYIHDGEVYINGVDIKSPGQPPDFGPKQVPANTLFVLGDPDGYSAINTSEVTGRAEYVLWSLTNPSRSGRPVP